MVDTHCHLPLIVEKNRHDNNEYQKKTNEYIKRSTNRGIETIVNVGTTVEDSLACVELAALFSPCFAVVGLHPTEINQHWHEQMHQLEKMLVNAQQKKIVGIGECGIDLFHKKETLLLQQDAFKKQIELAITHDLALVIHSRNAYDETLRIIESYTADLKRAVVHCFSYDLAFAQTISEWGLFVGIGGPVTYPKNEVLRTVVTTLFQSVVLETDAPFLPIQSMRGQTNAPEHIADICSFIAQLTEQTIETVDQQTSAHAATLFQFAHCQK